MLGVKHRFYISTQSRFSRFHSSLGLRCCYVQGVLDGFNATVFAYGCTGAGKTYTMIGNGQREHQGIMVLTLEDLFKQQRRVSLDVLCVSSQQRLSPSIEWFNSSNLTEEG